MKGLRKSNSSPRSLQNDDSFCNSLKRLALSRGALGSETTSSNNISSILSFNSKNNLKQSAIRPLLLSTSRTHVVSNNEIYGMSQDYFIQTGIHNEPIIQHNPKKNRKPLKFKRHLDYMPIQTGHFCFHKSDRRLKSLPLSIKRCLSEKHVGIRPVGRKFNNRKIRLEQRTQREPYPDSRPHIVNDKVQYSICRIPSPSFIRSGQSGQHKITRLGSEIIVKQIGSMIKNPVNYTITRFQESKNIARPRSPVLSRNQSPNLSPRSLSPVTSRIIIPNDLSESFSEPMSLLNMKTSQLPIYSPRTSHIQSPLSSPKSSQIIKTNSNNFPPLSPKHSIHQSSYQPVVLKIQSVVKPQSPYPQSTSSQIKQTLPHIIPPTRKSTMLSSQISDSSQDLLSSQVSGSGIITNLKSFTKTAASSGMFTQDSIRQMDQYQLDKNKNMNSHFRFSNTSIRS